MNYPELIWHLIDMLLQKEKNTKQETNESVKDNKSNAKKQNET